MVKRLNIWEDGCGVGTPTGPAGTPIADGKREQRGGEDYPVERQPKNEKARGEEDKHDRENDLRAAVIQEVASGQGNEREHEADRRDRCHVTLGKLGRLLHGFGDDGKTKRSRG